MTKWGKRLRKARQEMGLSLVGAAKLLHESHKIKLTKSELSKIELGQIDCTVRKFRGLCEIYSVDPKWVLDLKE